MPYLEISNTSLGLRGFYGVLNDFNKSVFDTQKREEAHGNTKNNRKQKIRFWFSGKINFVLYLLFTISIDYSVTIVLTSHRIKIKIDAFLVYSVQMVRSNLKAGKITIFCKILFWSE